MQTKSQHFAKSHYTAPKITIILIDPELMQETLPSNSLNRGGANAGIPVDDWSNS